MEQNREKEWYEYLKTKIMSEGWVCGKVDYAFMHGQVLFARTAGLITEEQKKELSDMIPEY
jgi:hypothetical protein